MNLIEYRFLRLKLIYSIYYSTIAYTKDFSGKVPSRMTENDFLDKKYIKIKSYDDNYVYYLDSQSNLYKRFLLPFRIYDGNSILDVFEFLQMVLCCRYCENKHELKTFLNKELQNFEERLKEEESYINLLSKKLHQLNSVKFFIGGTVFSFKEACSFSWKQMAQDDFDFLNTKDPFFELKYNWNDFLINEESFLNFDENSRVLSKWGKILNICPEDIKIEIDLENINEK